MPLRPPWLRRAATAAALGLAALPVVVMATATPTATARAAAAQPLAASQVHLLCDAIYLPARSSWARTVRITFDEQRVRGVDIDGLPVHSFNVQGSTVLTALDNERIRIDTAALTWNSDFRGLATAQGRCERQP